MSIGKKSNMTAHVNQAISGWLQDLTYNPFIIPFEQGLTRTLTGGYSYEDESGEIEDFISNLKSLVSDLKEVKHEKVMCKSRKKLKAQPSKYSLMQIAVLLLFTQVVGSGAIPQNNHITLNTENCDLFF